jgi:hypothetical protein
MGKFAGARRWQERSHGEDSVLSGPLAAGLNSATSLTADQPTSNAPYNFNDIAISNPTLRGAQAKLSVSEPSDPLELEADRIADQVVGSAQPEAGGAAKDVPGSAMPQFVARSSDPGVRSIDVDSLVMSTLGSGGEPLSADTRRFMEPRFGHDFSQVRVHTDEAATRSAQAVQAHAYTVGSDIVFSGGRYEPGTRDGDRLLAHELMHVVQQTGNNGAPTQLSKSPLALQRETATPPRIPVASAASAIPAQIKGLQATFHDRMQEASDIVEGTNFHYNYVNGIYAGCFNNYQVALGQAAEQKVESAKIAEEILAPLELAVIIFAPEGEAVGVVERILQIGEKIHKTALGLEKTVTILEALEGKEATEKGEGNPAPAAPSEFQILGLEHVVSLALSVAHVHNCGDHVLDGAVDLSTQIAADAPDSGALTAEQTAALNDALTSSQQVLAETEPLLASLRTLRDRRKVPIPSWAETEQDIWITYFTSIGRCIMEPVIENHMVDIGLWGRRGGPPGGRLGVSEEEGLGGGQVWEGTKTVPGREDEETQQSTEPQTFTQMQLIQAAAGQLPAKWRRIMLLTD